MCEYNSYFIRIVSLGNLEAISLCCIDSHGPFITSNSRVGGSLPKHCSM